MKKLILILGLVAPGMAFAQMYDAQPGRHYNVIVVPQNNIPWNTIQSPRFNQNYNYNYNVESWQDAYWRAYWNARRAGQ